jgi:hypothetical protein
MDELSRAEKELIEIRKNTYTSWALVLRNGFLQGAGFVVGSVLILALASYALSYAGLIPGFGAIANYLHQIVNAQAKQ